MSDRILYKENPAMFRNNPIGFIIAVVLIAAFGVGLGLLLIWWLRCKNTTLSITEERSILRTGILSKRLNEVWHRDVRNVQLYQGIFQRIFGVGKIGISSAGQAGVEVVISGIPNPNKAKQIIDEQKRIAFS